jgi:hypothetical protein
VPEGGDAYMLSVVIHDWDDKSALAILRRCRAAMSREGRLLLVEMVLPAATEPSLAALYDLTMMVMAGGRERTAAEYRTLLAAAGFDLRTIVRADSLYQVLEAVPTQDLTEN